MRLGLSLALGSSQVGLTTAIRGGGASDFDFGLAIALRDGSPMQEGVELLDYRSLLGGSDPNTGLTHVVATNQLFFGS